MLTLPFLPAFICLSTTELGQFFHNHLLPWTQCSYSTVIVNGILHGLHKALFIHQVGCTIQPVLVAFGNSSPGLQLSQEMFSSFVVLALESAQAIFKVSIMLPKHRQVLLEGHRLNLCGAGPVVVSGNFVRSTFTPVCSNCHHHTQLSWPIQCFHLTISIPNPCCIWCKLTLLNLADTNFLRMPPPPPCLIAVDFCP